MVLFKKQNNQEKSISQQIKSRDLFLKNFQRYLKTYSQIVLFIHERPDGDCLGGAFGMKEVLQDNFKGKKIYVVGENQGALPWLKMEFDELPYGFDFSSSLAIILDVGGSDRIQKFKEYFKGLGIKKWGAVVRVDHHDADADYYTDLSWVDPSYSACCCQWVQICDYYRWKLSIKAATYLYLGIMTDSGFFSNADVSPRTFILAAKVLRFGADREYLVSNLKKITREEIKLKEYILSNFVKEEGFVWFFMRKNIFEKYKPYTLSSGLVSCLGYIEDSILWMLLTEEESDTIRVSFRSVGELDVRKLALEFGGGGHINAAGATLDSEEKVSKLINVSREYVEKFLKEKKILSKDSDNQKRKSNFFDYKDPEYRLELTDEEKESLEKKKKLIQDIERTNKNNKKIVKEWEKKINNDPEWENWLSEAKEESRSIFNKEKKRSSIGEEPED